MELEDERKLEQYLNENSPSIYFVEHTVYSPDFTYYIDGPNLKEKKVESYTIMTGQQFSKYIVSHPNLETKCFDSLDSMIQYMFLDYPPKPKPKMNNNSLKSIPIRPIQIEDPTHQTLYDKIKSFISSQKDEYIFQA